jgi:hypothetical protein
MGYLERRVDPRDSRRKQLYATDLAEELKATKASVESFFYEWLVEDVPADELETFVSVLNRLNSKAKSERMEGFANLMARYAAQVGRTPTPKQRPPLRAAEGRRPCRRPGGQGAGGGRDAGNKSLCPDKRTL